MVTTPRMGTGPSPRVRGERSLGLDPSTPPPGHPRVCGENPRQLCRQLGADRAIPACAGRTATPLPGAGAPPGHPRVCGENASRGSIRQGDSSGHPRVCGENHPRHHRGSGGPPGHPRVCGENELAAVKHEGRLRAIPACAGRTKWAFEQFDPGSGPSPRVRGEHFRNTRFSEVRGARSLFRRLQHGRLAARCKALHGFPPGGVLHSDRG